MAGAPDRRAKRALLIGIDKYPKLTQLEGCVNDVQVMRSILQENFGFPPENVTLLADGQATRDAILVALDALVERTGRDDIVVIHYAGHGSQMTDREGDEPDGLDETIMPFDSEGRWGVNRDITDDEIHLRLLRLGEKTSYTTLIFDSCHSGTITRDAFGVKSRSVEPDRRPVSQLPPSPIPEAQREAMREPGPSGWMPLADQYVLLAGCRDEETSFEYRPPEGGGSVVHGAMTYFLTEQLRQATPRTGYRDVFERAAAGVNAANSNQHPQMEGRADREIFGVADLEPMRFVRVTARAGDTVTLAAGAALGMTVGSIWSVHPQGAKRTDGVEPLGQVEVTAVRAVTSEARVVREKTQGTIAKDTRAVETVHAYGDLRLKVQLVGAPGSAASLAALRQELQASPLLKVVGEGEPAAARIYLLAPRKQATPTEPVPQLGAVSAPTWAVVTENGELMMPPKGLDAYVEVKQNLEKLARYRQALALDNPDAGSALRGKFSLELLRQGADGKWIAAEPEAAGGQVVFEEGEAIAFRITSRHDAPVFVSLLDFGLTGAVSLVYPARGAKEKLAPGVAFEIGTRPGEPRFTLKMPKEFPYGDDNPARGAAVEGTETLKLFVTPGEADFAFLAQQGVRSAERARPGSPLMLLWQTACGGAAVRDISVSLPLGDEDWTTVVRPFALRRRSAARLWEEATPAEAERRRQAEAERRAEAPEPMPVLLGASAPTAARPGEQFAARFAAYVKAIEPEVREQLEEFSDRTVAHMGMATCRWRAGTAVKVRLTGTHLQIDPQEDSFVWEGDRQFVSFAVTVAPDAPTGGTVLKFEALIEGVVVARLLLDLEITNDTSTPERRSTTVEAARTAFASYASPDRDEVLGRVASLTNAAGLEVFLDSASLRAGRRWEEQLATAIKERELFLLFWSTSASRSKWVRWEWQAALREKGLDGIQPHPLEPVTKAPPPRELKALHFGDAYVLIREAYRKARPS